MNPNTARTNCTLATALFAGLAALAPAAQAGDGTLDDICTPTGNVWYTNVTADFVEDLVDDGYRLVDIEVTSTSPFRLAVSAVRNSGEYAGGWWYYYGLTAEQVGDYLEDNNARLVDIEPYYSGNNLRFAVIMIPNTGQNASGWWWLYGQTFQQLSDFINSNNARVIDVETYVTPGGERRFAAVMLPNTGQNAKTWWMDSNISPAQVSSYLSARNARLIDIEDRGGGNFTVVMERNQSGDCKWWWHYGLTAAEVTHMARQYPARIIDVERYPSGGGYRYAVLFRNNGNALETRVSEILRGGTDGVRGAYLKRVNGPVLASVMGDEIFEPASMIKVLHHVHAMRRVDAGTDALNNLVSVFTGASGSCPQDTGLVFEPLDDVLRAMMEQSDNNRTQAIRVRYGEAAINATAASLGMTDTLIQHRIGCAGGADGAIAEPNQLTLQDASRLYEAVATGLLSNANRQRFYDLMLNGLPAGVSQIVQQEGASLGLTAAERAEFLAGIDTAHKGGSYTFVSGGQTSEHRTRGGWISLPAKTQAGSTCRVLPREYFFGAFVNDATNGTNANNAVGEAWTELLRSEIRSAMQTWLQCRPAADWDNDGDVDVQDLLAYLAAFRAGRADFDGDGDTDVQDLLAYLAEFRNS